MVSQSRSEFQSRTSRSKFKRLSNVSENNILRRRFRNGRTSNPLEINRYKPSWERTTGRTASARAVARAAARGAALIRAKPPIFRTNLNVVGQIGPSLDDINDDINDDIQRSTDIQSSVILEKIIGVTKRSDIE